MVSKSIYNFEIQTKVLVKEKDTFVVIFLNHKVGSPRGALILRNPRVHYHQQHLTDLC